ncbi:hypothetical protein NKH18_40895 [Streptomyces sp. M10(2022)]
MSTSSGTIVSASAALHCPHGGRASATSTPLAVRLDGLPVHTASDTFVVTGCPHTVDGCRIRAAPSGGARSRAACSSTVRPSCCTRVRRTASARRSYSRDHCS